MLAFLALIPLVVGNAASGYTHVGGRDGVEVYRQTKSPVIDLIAEGDIDAPPSVVRDVLIDYPNAKKTSEHVNESRVLTSTGKQITVYQRLKLPVISDRDFTLRAAWGEREGMLWVRFGVDNSHGPAEREGVVRLSTLNGGWDLRPTRDGTATHAVYHVQIDLSGSLPMWMVSGGAAKDLPKLFNGVREQARGRNATASAAPRQSL
jgi:polyketide cyclase/dehydrase/lipid transport protein